MLTDHLDCLFKVAVNLDRAMFKGAINPSGLRHTDHGASVSLPSNRWGDDDNKVVQLRYSTLVSASASVACAMYHPPAFNSSVQFGRSNNC